MKNDNSVMDEVHDLYESQGAPYSAIFEITYKCGLKCFHCYNQPEQKAELTTQEAIKALGQLAGLGCIHLTFSGGECFCRRDWEELFLEARRLGFAINVITNGTLITPNIARKLKNLRVSEVNVSVYSLDHTIHDNFTGSSRSLAKTLKGIDHLLGQGVRVNIKCVLTRDTVTGYRDIIDYCKSKNLTWQFDTRLIPRYNGDQELIEKHLTHDQLLGLYQDSDVFHIISEPGIKPASGEILNCHNSQITCSAGRTTLSIDPYGNVYGCVQLQDTAGNIKEQDLAVIWASSPQFKSLRAVVPADLKECFNCAHRAHCARCPALVIKEGGELYGPSRYACEMAGVVEAVIKTRGRKKS